MKKQLFCVMLAIVFFLGFQACGKTQKAIEYNDTIVEYGNRIAQYVTDLVNSLKRADPDEMDNKLAVLQARIDESAEGVGKMGGFEGNFEFRDAAQGLLKYYQAIAENEFHEIVQILKKGQEEITQDDADYMMQVQEEIERDEKELFDELERVQKEFAKKYNFKIRKPAKFRS